MRRDIGFLDELVVDKLALILLALSVFAVAKLGLESAVIASRYGINVLTLAAVEILSLAFGGLLFVVRARRAEDYGFLPLVIIPITLRYVIPEAGAAFGVSASWSVNELVDVALLMLLVACAEESFKAMAVSEQLGLGETGQILASNTAWVALHFVQRPPGAGAHTNVRPVAVRDRSCAELHHEVLGSGRRDPEPLPRECAAVGRWFTHV